MTDMETITEKFIENNNSDKNSKIDNIAFRRQGFASLGTFMLNLGVGATIGFSAVLIPQLQSNSVHKYSTELISWVASISSLPLFCGSLISGYLMEKFGRRFTQVMLSIPFMVGWIIIAFAENIHFILLGRFITGFCHGLLGPLGPVFVGEISTPKYRGLFLASMSLAIASGVFLSHLFGTFLHWKYASILCALFPMTAFVILSYSRESPSWLISKGRIVQCTKNFYWYRGKSEETQRELEKMIKDTIDKPMIKDKLKNKLVKPEFWKPLFIMIIFFIMTQLSGVNVVSAYTTTLMKGLISSNIDANLVMLAIDILRCVSLLVACIILRHQGRRRMALISGVLTSTSLIALAWYLYLYRTGSILTKSSAITLSLLSLYIIVSHLGVVPLPWNMVGELFPTATRGLGSGISVMTTSIALFMTLKTAPALFESIGFDGTYLFYGSATLLGTIFLFFTLPETKDKTLLQVEEYFRSKSFDDTKQEFKSLQSLNSVA